jgi:hypothetical protein
MRKGKAMDVKVTNDRGFHGIFSRRYIGEEEECIVKESSAAKYMQPGSSYLWFGREHHLDEDQVRFVVNVLNTWLDTGCMKGGRSSGGRLSLKCNGLTWAVVIDGETVDGLSWKEARAMIDKWRKG